MTGSRRASRTSRRLLGAVVALAVSSALAAPVADAAWSVAPGTVPANTSTTRGVYCVSASGCLLVGTQAGVSSDELAASWNGTSFTGLTPSSPTSELYGTTCSPTLCWAVGSDYAIPSTPTPHAEYYDGTNWTTTSTPAPSGALYSELDRVACPTSSFCAAVGWYDTGGTAVALIEHYNGTSWSVVTPTLPANTVGAKLSGVTCVSASACWASGYLEVTGQPRKALVLTWNGTSWTVQTSATPSGANSAALNGITCTSSSACMAVGQYTDGSNVDHALAEEWDGTSWTLRRVPDPASGTDPVLLDVGCSSSSACEAVGYYSSSTPSLVPLAAGWNGSTWGLQSVPVPAGTSDNAFIGVACPSTCMGVGLSIYDGTTGITGVRPLVELGP
jgi:hypothetical protein